MTEELDEAQLARRAARQDPEAQYQLYRLTAGYLTAVGRRYVCDAQDLKDVLQDSYLKIFSQLHRFSYRGPGSLRAWTTRIVVNEAISLLRQRERMDSLSGEDDLSNLPEEDISEDDMDRLPPEVLQAMVSELPTGYRTVLNLYVFEDKSHQEIARLLGIKESSSASQLHRARQMLARKIKAYWKK